VARDLNVARREAADFQRRAEKAAAALAAAKVGRCNLKPTLKATGFSAS